MLDAPPEVAEQYRESVVIPALEAFEVSAPPLIAAELTTVLDDLIAGSDLPAVGVTVFTGSQILETAVAGVRRTGDATPVELTDKFSIGSNAKAMTATLVATYVDEGVVTWDTTVADIFDGALPEIHGDYADATLRQLLSHTAGINDELVSAAFVSFVDFDLSLTEQRLGLTEMTVTRPRDHAVGNYMYSNFGYTIVGAMLEELTGSPWEELVQTRVFDRLGMNSCGFYAPGTPGEVDQPWGHFDAIGGEAVDPGHAAAELPHVIAPAGLVHCNMADWATFLQSQLRGFRGSDSEIISPEAFVALQTPQAGSDYALGWVTNPYPKGPDVLYHQGSNLRFTAEVWLVPSENWGLLTVTNVGDALSEPLAKVGLDLFARRSSR